MGGVRDPHIYRGADGKTFYMVATDMKSDNGWSSNHGIVLLKSTNLIDWTYSRYDLRSVSGFDSVTRMWAPQTIYDVAEKKYMVYFASIEPNTSAEVIYYAYANDDFTTLATPQILYRSSSSKCRLIDPDIIYVNETYHLFFKEYNDTSGKEGLKKVTSKSASKDYTNETDYLQPTSLAVEGSTVFELIDSNTYVLMYDLYANGGFELSESTDLLNFKVTTRRTSFNFTPRHGGVMQITAEEKAALLKKWG
jgi:hypothetical protein